MICKPQGPCEAFGCTWPECASEPEPADDLVALSEKLLGQAQAAIDDGMQFRLGIVSKEIRDELPKLLKRIAADAETIRGLREERDELGYWKLRTHDYDAIISHSQDLKERAERAESERDALKKELKWRVELSEGYYVEAAKGWVKFRAAEAELRNIANADPSKWDADMRDQFQQWAQNRARAALAQGEE